VTRTIPSTWRPTLSDFGPRGEYGRIRRRPYQQSGWDRERRLQTTVVVGALALLLVGIGVGFSIGRATAPQAKAPAPVAQTVATLPVTPTEDSATIDASDTTDSSDTSATDDTSASTETTSDTQAPSRPKQTSPVNGAVLTTSRVTLRWGKSKDDSGKAVTYTFQVEDRISSSKYGNLQMIKGLKTRSYSVRVLSVRRRWRVWAVDSSGNASAKSPWHTYIKKYVAPVKKSSTTKSTDTTTTEH
jgi:hypothetical protein